MRFLTRSETGLLEALSLYKFLTNEQIERLGVKKGAANVRHFTKQFESKYPGTIGRVKLGTQAQGGKIPHLLYLTPKGAQFAAEALEMEPENIKFPATQAVANFRDYAHRVATIDFFIALRSWAMAEGFEVLFTDTYFDKIGANRGSTERLRAKTKIDLKEGYIIPDGSCMFDTGERRHLFLLEVYNGMDTKRVLEQLEKHVIAISEGSPSVKYDVQIGNFIAVVFDTEAAQNAVMKRVSENPHFKECRQHFKFRTIADFKESFYSGWKLFDGSPVNFI